MNVKLLEEADICLARADELRRSLYALGMPPNDRVVRLMQEGLRKKKAAIEQLQKEVVGVEKGIVHVQSKMGAAEEACSHVP